MELVKSFSPTTLFVTAAVVTSAALFLSRKSKKSRNPRHRSLSFSSESLLKGAFTAESNVAQPVINAVFYFKECPSEEKMIEKIKCLMLFDRFRSGAKQLSTDNWVLTTLPNDGADSAKDVMETTEFGSERELRQIIDDLCMKPLDILEDKPLWKLHRLVNKKTDSTFRKSVILIRIHHVIGDGISMIGAMTKFFENEDGGNFTLDIPEKMSGSSKFKFKFGFFIKIIKSFLSVLLLPQSAHDTNITFCPDHHKNKKMPKKCINIEFPVMKLDFIKEIKNKANVTVNDVLLAATSGMIKRFSMLNNDPALTSKSSAKKVSARALVPVAFPRPKKDLSSAATALRNLWSFISVPLFIKENTARDRLINCCKSTKKLKRSPAALIQLFLQDKVLSIMPTFFARQTAFDVFSRHSIVFSNLPGPANMIKLAGEELLGFQISFPNLIPQVIIISYNNGIFFNLCIDEEIIANSADISGISSKREILTQLFVEEIKELASSYGVATDDDKIFKNI